MVSSGSGEAFRCVLADLKRRRTADAPTHMAPTRRSPPTRARRST
jgi:hypothetical protein